MPTEDGWLVGGADYDLGKDYHHPCGEWVPIAERDEHFHACTKQTVRVSMMDWDVAQAWLLAGGINELLADNDFNYEDTRLDIAVVTGFRWLPTAGVIRTLAEASS